MKVDAQDPGCTVVPDTLAASESGAAPVAGNYTSTFVADNVYEQLRESAVKVGGKSYSRLTHTWTFQNVPSGATHKLRIEAHKNSGADEDFVFLYSIDGGSTFNSIPGATVNQAITDQYLQPVVPASFFGTILIQVQDSNRQNTSSQLDSIFVDFLAIGTLLQ